MIDACRWKALARALDEGHISIILENAENTIDGGLIITQLDELIDFLEEDERD